MDIEAVAREIVDSSVKIHRSLGPGLLESAYQACLAYELKKRGLKVDREVPVPIVYDGVQLDIGYRLDMLVNGGVNVENKAVEKILPIHEAQLLTYLKIKDCRLGFILNWNVPLMKYGIRGMANGL
jgi:GxxExxY protein